MNSLYRWSLFSESHAALPVARVLIFPATLIFIFGMLVGGFSLARLSPRFTDLGLFGEVRLIATISAAFLAALAAQGRSGHMASSQSTVIWVIAVCGLHCVALLTWIWSERTDFAAQQFYELTLLIAALLIAYHIFGRDPERVLRMLLFAFWGLAVIFCLLGILLSGAISGDLAALGAGGIGSARLLGMGVLFSFLLFLRTNKVLNLVPVPIFLMGMMLSGSRASVLALVFAILLLWMCRAKIAKSGVVGGRRAVLLFALFSVAMLAVAIAVPASRAALIGFALSNITAAGGGVSGSGSGIYLADRDTIFLTAWESFSANLLSGSGIGTYVGPFGESYPHNIALNFAVDGGVLCLAGFAVAVIWPVMRIIKVEDTWAIGALSAGVFFLIASLFAGTYYDARFVWIFFLLGLLCADKRRKVLHLGRCETELTVL